MNLKKLSIFSLLFIFCFNIVGFYALFGIQLFHARKEMFIRLSSGSHQELNKIRITSEEEEPLEFHGGTEFYFKGAMYDLVKKEELNDGSLLLYSYLDLQETSVLKAFSKLLKTGRENHRKKNSALKIFFKPFPKINSEEGTVKMAFLTPLKNPIFGTSFLYSSLTLEEEAPPPRQV